MIMLVDPSHESQDRPSRPEWLGLGLPVLSTAGGPAVMPVEKEQPHRWQCDYGNPFIPKSHGYNDCEVDWGCVETARRQVIGENDVDQ